MKSKLPEKKQKTTSKATKPAQGIPKTPSMDKEKSSIVARMLFKKRIPLFWMLFTWAVLISIFFLIPFIKGTHIQVTPAIETSTHMNQIRKSGFHLTHPLLTTDVPEEDSRDAVIKANIEQYIEKKKAEGALAEASVYFRRMNDGGWFAINPDKGYAWGSLGKLPLMTSYLADADKDRALLDRKIYFEKSVSPFFQHVDKVFTLAPQKYYSIKVLLHYMIAYSDNDALDLLYRNMNQRTVDGLLSDLQIPVPDLSKDVSTINVKEYSRFFRILYSATYLSRENSEYALNLLTQCDFKDGICKKIPSNILVAHKFGERSDPKSAQLHEFGIIYAKDQPYLLGIMTRGYDNKQLTGILADISGMIYDFNNLQPD